MRAPRCLVAFVLLLPLGAACERTVPGVLTLAPAGMHATDNCVAQPDGTLTMPPGSQADAVAYVDAGTVTISVTAKASVNEPPALLELWFAGDRIGILSVERTESQPFVFHGRARRSGPTALRLAYPQPAAGHGNAALAVEKVVITQP